MKATTFISAPQCGQHSGLTSYTRLMCIAQLWLAGEGAWWSGEAGWHTNDATALQLALVEQSCAMEHREDIRVHCRRDR